MSYAFYICRATNYNWMGSSLSYCIYLPMKIRSEHWHAAAIILFVGGSMSLTFPESNCSQATVDHVQGVCIYVDSQPVRRYETLGTVTSTLGLSGQYAAVRNRLINKARKKFPAANGLIFTFKKGGTDSAIAIKFK